MKPRGKRKTVEGVVTSDKMQKTIAVSVEYLAEHPIYGKRIRRRTKYYAHDEAGEAKVGDKVEIVETRPLSKKKRWRLVRVVERA